MNFNTEIFAGNKIKDFKKALGLPEIGIGEVYAVLKWNNIRPLYYVERVGRGKTPVYSRYEVESLLRSHNSLMISRERIIRNKIQKQQTNAEEQEKDNNFEKNYDYTRNYVPQRRGVNYYSSDNMWDASNELLMDDNEGVIFEDANDDRLYESLFGKRVYFTENQINRIKKNLLNESSQDKAAIRFLKSKGVDDYEEQKRILGALKHDIPNLRLDKGKFVVAALRMYYDGELGDERSISSFDKALSYIHKGNHTNEYDFDLNGLSLTELNNKYSDLIKQDLNSDIERSNNVVFSGVSDYKIIPIKSYEEASEYGEYTSWCVTHGEDAYDSYTKGGKRFYFCLKNGFENLPEIAGENAPLDEYGLSMISVLVDMDGSLDRLTTRWNHEYNGENNPGLSTPEQLEKVLNLPFYKTFKPYARDELHAMGIILFDEVQELLDSGMDAKEIFDDVDDFYEDFARVQLNGKWNFIDREGKLLSPNQWFDGVVGKFYEGFAIVQLNGKCNLINTKGELFDLNKNPLNESRKSNKHNIYITESQLNTIKESLNFIEPKKVLLVKRYLDNNFVRGAMPTVGEDGYSKSTIVIGMKGTDGNVIRNMYPQQVLDLLIDKFQKIYCDKGKREHFLKQLLIDWYNKKISRDGLLSINRF